jgi:hypothetical protein
MEIKIVTDFAETERLWKKFSPHKTLWDEWELVRPLYHLERFTPLVFVLVDEQGVEHGVLPLWLEKEYQQHYAFGGDYLENIGFWFPMEYFPLVVSKLPPTKLFDVSKPATEAVLARWPEYQSYFKPSQHRYFLPSTKYNYSVEEYLQTFGKKHRYNLLRDIKKLSDLNYEIVWETDEHFDDFIRFNQERFGEESDFSEPEFIDDMREIVSYLVRQNQLRTVTVVVNGQVIGLELACEFKGIWYVLNGGQAAGFDNVGKLMIMEHIKEAFKRKCQEVDFLAGDSGWKKLWNLDQDQYYNFSTPDYVPVSPEDQ